MASIKETFSTTAKKDINAEIKWEDEVILFKTEEMEDFQCLTDELKYFNGKAVKMTFKVEDKTEELPEEKVDEE